MSVRLVRCCLPHNWRLSTVHAWFPALKDQTLDFSYGEVILIIIIIGQPVQLYQGE